MCWGVREGEGRCGKCGDGCREVHWGVGEVRGEMWGSVEGGVRKCAGIWGRKARCGKVWEEVWWGSSYLPPPLFTSPPHPNAIPYTPTPSTRTMVGHLRCSVTKVPSDY